MNHSDRREFFAQVAMIAASGASLAAVSGCAPKGASGAPAAGAAQPGAATPAVGVDSITQASIEEAEKLAGIRFTPAERAQMLRTIKEHRETLDGRMKLGALPNELAPAEVLRVELPDNPAIPVTPEGDPNELPMMKIGRTPPPDEDLAYAQIPWLAAMLRAKVVTSRKLAELSLSRLERLNPTLLCAITILREHALKQADAADAQIAAGKTKGPLHGIPYAAKDILDTGGIRTTWGAEPWRDRVPQEDAWVVSALEHAGAVLVAKTAVGALAYGDIWFGGTCKNPWNTKEGSSGSSAGSASAVAAGIVPFAIGTETLGSIVSPCTRCGVSGLRPTFGRVPRTGCMSLVWSMDKIGTIARSVTDCGIVLNAINGYSSDDPSSVSQPFTWSMRQDASGLRVGYCAKWFEGKARAAYQPALDALKEAGAELVELEPPKVEAAPLIIPLITEAAAAFEELTRTGADDTLSWQADEAWPNTFRQAWFIPAVAAVQASRMRRRAMEVMHEFFAQADCVVCPPFAGEMLLLTNSCGQPCVVARCGFEAPGKPRTITLMGRLFDEGTPLRAAAAIEARLGGWESRPVVGA